MDSVVLTGLKGLLDFAAHTIGTKQIVPRYTFLVLEKPMSLFSFEMLCPVSCC